MASRAPNVILITIRWEFVPESRRQFPSNPAIAADGTLYSAAAGFYALGE